MKDFDTINGPRRAGHSVAFPWPRFFLLICAGLAALAGTFAALLRSNLPSPVTRPPLADAHGALMVFGFLGTAICLERGVAFRAGSPRKPAWGFLAPLSEALGMLSMILIMMRVVPMSLWQLVPGIFWAAGMSLLSAVYAVIWARQHSVSVLIQILGSAAGACSAGLWASGINASALAPWWMVFLVLTIVGERLELAHVSFVGRYVEPALIASSAAAVLSLPLQLMLPPAGYAVLGLALFALLVTMLLNDTAIKTWKVRGVIGFMGVCMLLGYAWALFASILWIFRVYGDNGYWADMGIHALALGFTISMVIAHVCVIVPSVIRRAMPYSPVLWLPLALLHLGLVLRLLGAARGVSVLWQTGDFIDVIAVFSLILCVLGMNIYAASRRRRNKCHAAHPASSGSPAAPVSSAGPAEAVSPRPETLAAHPSGHPRRSEQPHKKDSRHLKHPEGSEPSAAQLPSREGVRRRVTQTHSDISDYARSRRTFFTVSGWSVLCTAAVLLVCSLIIGMHPALVANQGGVSGSPSLPQGLQGLQGQGQHTAAVAPTGKTTTVKLRVGADGMSFAPARLAVPAGNRLVIEFSNTGDQTHDLVVDNGATTGRVSPGEVKKLDAGVIAYSMEGWCSLAGHRQMGMSLHIAALDNEGNEIAGPSSQRGSHVEQPSGSDSNAQPSTPVPSSAALRRQAEKSAPYDPRMPDYTDSQSTQSSGSINGMQGVVRRVTMTVTEAKITVAEGFTQTVMRYNGTVPGPVLRGKVGDVFEVTLVNKGSMDHSLDFHAGDDAAPDKAMRSVKPGKSLAYTFRASRAGIWMYHCSTAPMTVHIAGGMYGAVVVEPQAGLPRVDKEYVLVGGEMYLGGNGKGADTQKIARMVPDIAVFNGRAFQYDAHPLTAQAGKRIRIWVMNDGISCSMPFHVIGAQFSSVWTEGRYTVKDNSSGSGAMERNTGSQVLPLMPAQGGFVEIDFQTPGRYPFVNHSMSLAEKGQHGYIDVSK